MRRRAVLAIAELPDDRATAVLVEPSWILTRPCARPAALAAGARGVVAAVPTLVGMVVEGASDVEAAEVLGALSVDAVRAERILEALVEALDAHPTAPAVRIRLAQALVELPGAAAGGVLERLAGGDDRDVALVASALARVLDERGMRDSPTREA